MLEAACRTGRHQPSRARLPPASSSGSTASLTPARSPRRTIRRPGVAREYWPLDLDSWASCEGYGWGANTASLLMRQVFGFFEGPDEDAEHSNLGAPGWRASRLRFSLTPNLPPEFLVPGQTYRVANLPYRGAALNLGYRVETAGLPDEPARLTLLLAADVPTACTVTSADGVGETPPNQLPPGTRPLADRHAVPISNGAHYEVVLRPAAL